MTDVPGTGPFYHGCKADLTTGDLLIPGYMTNYGTGRKSNFVYFSATVEAAIWGAELAQGTSPGRIYIVDPTGPSENDPNLTDRKFPGNPTRSYRTRDPLRIVGEITGWTGHTPDQLRVMHDHLARLKEQGIAAADD